MTQGSASHRDDVEQLGRRFAEVSQYASGEVATAGGVVGGSGESGEAGFDYLTELQRHARELADHPSEWMP